MEERGTTNQDLIRVTGHTPANISRLNRGKVKAVRLSTLFDICDELDCDPGDIIVRIRDEDAADVGPGVYIIDPQND